MNTLTPHLLALRRITGYLLLAAVPFSLAAQAAFAQAAPPDAPPDAQAPQTAQNDPPGRVARLNYTAGTVTTQPAGATDWSYAQINRPLTTGDQLWNDKGARSELHLGSTAVRLGESTSLDVLNLDDSNAQLKVAQGTLSTRVRSLPAGSTYEIDTPNLALGVSAAGDYRVDVAPDGSSTTVTVRSGAATVYGDNAQVPVQAGQQVTFTGTNLQQTADNGAPQPDAFDQWASSRDAAEDRSVSARYVSRDIPGYQDLDANGTWRDNPQYGEVWVPNAVPTGWAPYRDGHWIWQAPWGWTWIDDAPWGFAPYHYGRWAYVDNAWAWAPGPIVEAEPPVYAPALVAFVGGGDSHFNWGVNLAIGGAVAAAGVAWFPLGPGEPWHPRGGDWSPHYYDRVNRTVVVNNDNRQMNVTNINVHNTYVNYRAPGGVTAVPATAFVHGQPVGRYAQKVDPRQWRNARINPGTPGIAPVRESFNPGMRNANSRPPSNVTQRPVIATRSPVMPAVYHDNLAQRFARSGGRVPNAGNPVVRTSVPAHLGNRPRQAGSDAPAQNVRVVQAHGPGATPARGEGQVAQRPGTAPQRPGAVARAPGAAPQHPGQPPQMANAHPQPANGVPRPPQVWGNVPNGGQPHPQPEAAAGQPRQQPAWTQPHAPMAQQAPRPQQPGSPMQGHPAQTDRGAPQPPNHAENPAVAQQPRQEFHPQAQPPQAQQMHQPQQAQSMPHPQPAPQQAAQAPHTPEMHAQQQPRPQPAPQPVQQPPREAFHPQPQPRQQAQQPRPEPRPQPQPQPRPEFHPQQAQQPRPQPAPQPHPQPPPQVQQPHAQPHPDQHATGGGEHQEHQRG
ncbi:DUF6600 domain-containing protein [Paraburkholderia gardini]|uniref:FecR protein domain-containing protein n=1 Tax=Paraburkholderia gardini TaxID=2823469 RepID=A0ABN7QFZ0_9BURK|nr:DUF6600 domain-containing protein [Paraburkholderia gardini]CAG4890894.1 hypothetical protein R54767_01051 [Paraburkholderia gardini]CAG4893052.1 hypothetical protein R69919_01579 [Paraburkholderia gardini]